MYWDLPLPWLLRRFAPESHPPTESFMAARLSWVARLLAHALN